LELVMREELDAFIGAACMGYQPRVLFSILVTRFPLIVH
jgi:hypothetical protein